MKKAENSVKLCDKTVFNYQRGPPCYIPETVYRDKKSKPPLYDTVWAAQNNFPYVNKDNGVPLSLKVPGRPNEPVKSYPWSWHRQWRIGRPCFSGLCVEILNGQHPGQLSKGHSKGLRESWTHGGCYENARLNNQYWFYDVRSPFQMPPKTSRILTSVTAHPPHNLKRVHKAAFKPKNHLKMKDNVPI